MIAVEPGSAVYQECLSPASNPTFSVTHEACARIIRNPSTGGATASNVSYINAGGAFLSGVDSRPPGRSKCRTWVSKRLPGPFSVNFLVSTLLDLDDASDAHGARHRLEGLARAPIRARR